MLLFADILILSMLESKYERRLILRRQQTVKSLTVRSASSSPVLLLLCPIKNVQHSSDCLFQVRNSHTTVTAKMIL